MGKIHSLHKSGQPIPEHLQSDFIEYSRKMGILPTICDDHKPALFAKFGDDITLSQVCEALERGETVELWRIDNKYTLKIKDGGTIDGMNIVVNNNSFKYCGDVSVKDIVEFNKL